MYLIHGLVLYVSWGALLVLQVCSIRYLKHLWLFNMWIHGLLGTATGIMTVYACVTVFVKEGRISLHGHSGFGFFFFLFSSFMISGGLIEKFLLERIKWRTFILRTGARIHKYFALFVLFYG